MRSLIVRNGPLEGRCVEVESEVVIGREHGHLLLEDDDQVSRRHAAVRATAGGLEIEDLGSRNGTWVNGTRIEKVTGLRAADIVGVGRTLLAVEVTRPVLDVTSGSRSTRVVVAGELLIGREDASLVLEDELVSRRHALVRATAEGLELEDLGSRNGTWVNQRRLEGSAPLQVGDVVEVGDTVIEVVLAVEADPSPPDGSAVTELAPAAALPAERPVPAPALAGAAEPPSAVPPGRRAGALRHLGEIVHRRPRVIIALTIVLVLGAGYYGVPVAAKLSGGGSNFEDTGSESIVAREQLQRAGDSPAIALIALVEPGSDVRSSSGRAKVAEVAQTIANDPGVAGVVGFEQTKDDAFVSRDGSATYLAVSFEPGTETEDEDTAARIQAALEDDAAVTLGGGVIAGEQVGEQVGMDLARAELLAFPILFLLALFVFRGLVAALLPIVCGLIAIVGAFFTLRVANEVTPLSVFALNLVTGIGLGLAIDYSLFIVSRYREELARVGPGLEALRATVATAGRTVLFSALTVAVALAGLLVFPQPFLYSMGLGGIFVSLISAAVALVFLPALLAVLGTRVNSLAPARWKEATERTARAEQSGFWYRLSQAVMRRPGPIAIASAAALIALGIPFLHVEFTGVDASVLPSTASARQVDDALRTRFPPSRGSPIYAAVEAPASAQTGVSAYAATLRELPGTAFVSDPQRVDDGLWKIETASTEPALAGSSKELVERIRSLETPFPVRVGGETAQFVDQQASIAANLPLGLAILAVGTFVLLFLMTGSVVLPLKALVMNLLTLSAAFGICVLVFQDGNLEGFLGFTSQGALESTQPVLLFVVAFALSTDYAVFLLTRIKEGYDAGLSNTDAVARGLERTGRIVTAAALLFCVAIGAFSTSEIVFIKLIGVGTAAAVILDATIVRALLVPSLMKLLGDRNWWAPGPLRRLHARVGLREA